MYPREGNSRRAFMYSELLGEYHCASEYRSDIPTNIKNPPSPFLIFLIPGFTPLTPPLPRESVVRKNKRLALGEIRVGFGKRRWKTDTIGANPSNRLILKRNRKNPHISPAFFAVRPLESVIHHTRWTLFFCSVKVGMGGKILCAKSPEMG